jgi:hypothetical protein
MFLTPELADYLRENVPVKVQDALNEYYAVAPYWFVSFSEEGFAENAINPLYDSHSIFMAKALILQESGGELEKYLDVPGFERGDLYYIQKLVAILENQGFTINVIPSFQNVQSGEDANYLIDVQFTSGFTETVSLSASQTSDDLILNLYPTQVIPPIGQATFTITDTHPISSTESFVYSILINAIGGDISKDTRVYFLVNGFQISLPLVFNKGG